MYRGRTTLSKFLIQQLSGIPGASDLGALLVDVAAAVKAISLSCWIRNFESVVRPRYIVTP